MEQPIFRAVVNAKPDLYISLGDAIYADYNLETRTVRSATPDSLRREWQVLADNPDWQHLRAHVPVMATWDNHDYGHHSAGAEFEFRRESESIFLDFFGEPQDSPRRTRPGVYDARVFGPAGRRLQVILLDTRSFKSPPVLAERTSGTEGSLGKYSPDKNAAATLLGDAQWRWLEQKLQESAEVRLIASSGQIVANQKGMDEWGNYPRERQRLIELIGDGSYEGTILLSGNVHFAEISQTGEGGYPLLDFTSSGLTHVNEQYAAVENPYRVAGPYVAPQFGLVEMEWGPHDLSGILLAVIDLHGDQVFSYQVDISEK
jgi:alkaline phosphatase D